jgi:predicted nucleotide-binding protein
MAEPKPRVFVGSSGEAKKIAGQFCDVLDDTAIMVPWWDSDEFHTMFGTFETLFNLYDNYDFGLFILSADDGFESRGEKGKGARDNVLFELGLFLGNLGRDRALAVIEEGMKVPSDLVGVTIPRFKKANKDEMRSSIRKAARQIAGDMERVGTRYRVTRVEPNGRGQP